MNLNDLNLLSGNTALFQAQSSLLSAVDLLALKRLLEGQIQSIKDSISETNEDDRLQRLQITLRRKKDLLSSVETVRIQCKERESKLRTKKIEHEKKRIVAESQDNYLLYFHRIAKASLPECLYEQLRLAAHNRSEAEKAVLDGSLTIDQVNLSEDF